MRNGLLFALLFLAAAGFAFGQAPFPYPGGPGPMPFGPMGPGYPPPFPPVGPMPGFPPGGMMGYPPAPYPPPFYYPPPQGLLTGPYNPYPVPVLPPAPAAPAHEEEKCPGPPPSIPRLPVCPEEPCEPMFVTKPGCAGSCVRSSLADCMPPPCQAPGGYCFYGRIELLYWWFHDQSVAGLTNIGTIGGSTVIVPGFSVDLASVVPGYNWYFDSNHWGLRYTNGVWLNEENTWAIEGNIFAVGISQSPYYASGGPGVPASAASIASMANLLNLSVADTTGLLSGLGTTSVVSSVGFLAGTELNLRHEICRCAYGHVDWLVGARFLDLNEIGGVMDSSGGIVAHTQNQFFGGQVGLEGELSQGRFFLDGVGKVALGNNHQIVSIGTTGSGPTSFSALQGNQGVQNRDVFATVAEVGVTAGFRLTYNTRLFANYTLIYLTDAVRPLPQLGPYLGGALPAFSFMSSPFWAQGASVGFEFRF